MENVPLEAMKTSFQKILDIARCAICLETVRPEIVQCVKGHLLCGECRQDLSDCPTCRQAFSSTIPSLVLCQMLDALPKRCKYMECGEYQDVADDHERWCGFQPTWCKILCCNWTGQGREILSHIQQHHPSVILLSESNDEIHLPLQSVPSVDLLNCFYPIWAHGQVFWMYTRGSCGMSTIQFILVPNGKPNESVFIELSFKSKESYFQTKFRFNLEQNEGMNIWTNTVCLPNDILRNFLREDQDVLCNVYITLG
uniref:RING-type domain-containing protein n=2 Tax=Graphocephala atropunctata TaxID=36148 RepID=A0A1B6KLA8_9HEMI